MSCRDWGELELSLKHCSSVEELKQCLEELQSLFFVVSSSTSNLTDAEKLTICQSTGIQQELIFNVPSTDQQSSFVIKFSRYLRILLEDVAIKWLSQISENEKKKLYYSNFIYGPVLDCFLTILSSLKQGKHLKVIQACYDVLKQFVSVGRLQQLIVEKSLARSNVEIESLATYLCNIPECIDNKMNLLNTHDMFEKSNYIVVLMQNILGALERLQHQSSVKYDFVGKLVGKLAVLGDKNVVVQCLLEFVNRGHENGEQVSEVLTFVSSQHLEAVTLPFFTCDYIPFHDLKQFIDIVFGPKIVLIGKLCTLIYHRLIFIKYFKDVRPKYLLFYPLTTREERRYLLTKTLFELLTVWGNKSSVDLQPYEHHLAICESIIICFYYMDNDERVAIKEKIMMLLAAGMPVHLDSNHSDFRRAGMVTAEILTQFLGINTDAPLKFDYDETDDTRKLKSLLEGYTEQDFVVKEPPVQLIVESDNKVPDKFTNLDSDDDDEDLKPFSSSDKNLASVKPPVYLKECIEILTETRESDKDIDKIAVTLRTLPKLLNEAKGNADELALEITQIILSMSSEFYMEDFNELRKKILINCTVAAPRTVADYLSYQFYEDNYTIGHRLDILNVIVEASRVLSRIEVTPQEDEIEKLKKLNMKPWEIEVLERLKKKTKRFNSATKIPIGKENKFNSVCGNFFYALMNQYDKELRTLSLTEEDTLVLGRLIYTLGVVLHCASNAPAAPNMGKTLLDFVRVFTDIYVLDEYVKQAILFSTSIVAQISPVAVMTAEIYPQLMDIRLWAEELLTESISADTTELAVYALDIMDTVIGRGLFPSDMNSLSKEYAPLSLKNTVINTNPKISEISSSDS